MTFGPEYSIGCISRFSTPFTAFYVVTPTVTSDSSQATGLLDNDGLKTATSVLTQGGIAIADPVVVGWEQQHLSLFPADYASSLAQRIGVPFTASSAVPASTSSLPQPTSSSSSPSQSKSPRLPGGTIAGIVIGVILAVALVGVVLFLVYVRKRCITDHTMGVNETQLPEMEGQSSGIVKWFSTGRWRQDDSKRKAQELNANGGEYELDGEGPRQELDSRAVVVVPGGPVELDADESQKVVK